MNYRNPRAIAQQIAQLAIGSLLDNYYGSRIPPEFRGDWVEFLRAYRSGFVWWLQHEAERSVKSSGASFAELLLDLAGTGEEPELGLAFEQVYDGLSLSSEVPDKKDLEGRFLRWLSKQR